MDNRETLKALVELAKKATPGPWHGFEDKFGPSREDHGYRLLAEFSRRKGTAWALYGEASAMWVPGNGWTWGDDIQFVIAARNAIPALEALLAEPASVPVSELEALASKWIADETSGPDAWHDLRSLINRSQK